MSAAELLPSVLVTGATGALGPAVVNLLGARGYRVRAVGLGRPEGLAYRVGVDSYTGDICDVRLLDEAMAGASHVVHMAALLHINNPGPELASEYERVNVRGTGAVVEAALRHGVKRLVFLSTIAVYGEGRGAVLTEETEPRPESLYAQTKLDAEQLVLGARGDSGHAIGVVLRLAAVYGSHVKGNYNKLVTALEKGRFVPVGQGNNRRTLVQERDVAAAIALALQTDAAAGRVYNVTDGEVHALREIIDAICVALGRPYPRLTLPAAPVRAAARLGDGLARVTGKRLPIGSAMLEKYLEDIAVDGGRITRELGYRPTYDLKSGWREAVAGRRGNSAETGRG